MMFNNDNFLLAALQQKYALVVLQMLDGKSSILDIANVLHADQSRICKVIKVLVREQLVTRVSTVDGWRYALNRANYASACDLVQTTLQAVLINNAATR